MTAIQGVQLDSIAAPFYGTVGANATATIWYTTTAINGTPNIASPAWTQIVTSYPVTIPQSSITGPLIFVSVPIPGGLMIPANSTYGFYIGITSGGNTVYTTYSTGQSLYTDGIVSVETGTNVGYGGSTPSPVNHPRQFNGRVIYRSAATVNWATLGGTSVGTGDTVVVYPNTTTTYVATISDNNCSKSDTVVVT